MRKKDLIDRFKLGLIVLITVSAFTFIQTDYTAKYSGAYNIVVTGQEGDNAEAYALRSDGTATWVFGYKDRSGKLQTQKKDGKWEAKANYIKIIIQGNSGPIIEEYNFKNGKFVNSESSSRYLKKRS